MCWVVVSFVGKGSEIRGCIMIFRWESCVEYDFLRRFYRDCDIG